LHYQSPNSKVLPRRTIAAAPTTTIVATATAAALTAALRILGSIFHVRSYDHSNRFFPAGNAAMSQTQVACIVIVMGVIGAVVVIVLAIQ
jgi:hypothetical protein